MIYAPEGAGCIRGKSAALRKLSAMEHAMHTGMILEARAVLCDSSHNLAVSLPCMRGIIPREEGAMGIAEGTTKDIALIARAGKPGLFPHPAHRRGRIRSAGGNPLPAHRPGGMLEAVSLPLYAG